MISIIESLVFGCNFEPPKISTEQLLQTIDEYFEKKEKEPSLVGINIPDKSTDDETTTADRLLAKNIADYIEEIHRHGRKGSSRPRVLKIRLEDKYMAMSILRNKNLRPILRKEFYIRNQNLNLKKYVVRNLQIVELRQPRQCFTMANNFSIPVFSHQSYYILRQLPK
ncbi:unnamed protein product [Dracunculus medinensis]|uniref:PAZ domain-containing protein n=1 Tax=Dracunculus medinensis TaxID=318479 RepID=A0A0N4UD69_DRAME|nr:unnamed protein product [Dracunculus medinensis]